MNNSDVDAKKMQDKKNFRVGCLAVLLIFVAVVAWVALGDHSSEPSGLEAYVASQNFVKQKLKAPATAKFPVYDKSMVVTNDNKRFKVESYVDAQNSFGASVRTKYVCIVTHIEGNEWQLESVQLLD